MAISSPIDAGGELTCDGGDDAVRLTLDGVDEHPCSMKPHIRHERQSRCALIRAMTISRRERMPQHHAKHQGMNAV
jgi:hypothetical protein